jgi:aryl-alcohol dehydrogenase-like predicted oxidoreductase
MGAEHAEGSESSGMGQTTSEGQMAAGNSGSEMVSLGTTGIQVSPLGMGTWQWGDMAFWGYGRGYGQTEVEAAYAVSRAAGINFFDTAEIYGRGTSERILGRLVRGDDDSSQVVVASKFAPLPQRLSARSITAALDASLARLGVQRLDLYYVHWNVGLIALDRLMNTLADAVEAGKIRAIGVSNYGERKLCRAHTLLARRGLPLAANQVHYSLLHRAPERGGVLAACRELDVRLVAYSPLEQGVLTGKYHRGEGRASAARRLYAGRYLRQLEASRPLIALLERIGAAHDKTPGQVALRWLIQQGAVPIPGAKNAAQATANAGALGWQLTENELKQLTEMRIA